MRTEYGESRRVNRLIDVPRDPFRLIECWLVSNSEATDQGLAWLAGCRDLERLYLQGTPVTDAGLAHFKNCARLTHLHLFGTALTDAGLAHFSGCENLKELQISLTKATDAGLAHIRSYRQLDRLNLHGTRVTDRGLAHFKDCRQLSYLNLKSLAGVTDAGLANFKDCTALQAVVLEETQVSDASIEMLIQRAPKELYLRQTKVSSEGLTKLIAALPDCKFDIEPLDAPPQSNPMADRKAAEWVLAVGGHVEVVIAPNRRIRVTKPAALPEEPFKLVVCDLSYFRAILGNTRHEDAALACFEGCVDLEELWINGWPLRKGSMAPFRQCKKLTILQLYDTGVTDDGLALFRDHQRLKHVNLARSNVSEAALIEFIRGRTFELLALPPKATDACIDEVIRTNPSKQLSLQGTAITEDGRKRLAAALPQCRIEWDDGVIGPRTR